MVSLGSTYRRVKVKNSDPAPSHGHRTSRSNFPLSVQPIGAADGGPLLRPSLAVEAALGTVFHVTSTRHFAGGTDFSVGYENLPDAAMCTTFLSFIDRRIPGLFWPMVI